MSIFPTLGEDRIAYLKPARDIQQDPVSQNQREEGTEKEDEGWKGEEGALAAGKRSAHTHPRQRESAAAEGGSFPWLSHSLLQPRHTRTAKAG